MNAPQTASQPLKRGRGRPRKHNPSNADESKSPLRNHIVEEIDIEEEDIVNVAKDQKTRGHYHSMTFATKLQVLRRFDEFKQNQQIIAGNKTSFEEFFKILAGELSEKWQSVKCLCSQYSTL